MPRMRYLAISLLILGGCQSSKSKAPRMTPANMVVAASEVFRPVPHLEGSSPRGGSPHRSQALKTTGVLRGPTFSSTPVVKTTAWMEPTLSSLPASSEELGSLQVEAAPSFDAGNYTQAPASGGGRLRPERVRESASAPFPPAGAVKTYPWDAPVAHVDLNGRSGLEPAPWVAPGDETGARVPKRLVGSKPTPATTPRPCRIGSALIHALSAASRLPPAAPSPVGGDQLTWWHEAGDC